MGPEKILESEDERNKGMEKAMLLLGVVAVSASALAWCGPCGPGWGPPPPPCHGDWWGRGGCNFWPGFIGGVVGGLAFGSLTRPVYRDTVVVQQTPTVVTQPVVIQQPAVVTQPVVVQQPAAVQQPTLVRQSAALTPSGQMVWVEGSYIEKVQSNGTTVRVWNPGHYEQRAIMQ